MYYDDIKFDKRIVDRLIAKGLVSKEEYEQYLRNLPDLKNKTETVTISVRPGQFEQAVLPAVREDEAEEPIV